MKKIVMLLVSILLLCGCNKTVSVSKYNMFYMDTYIEVKLYDVPNNKTKEIFKKIDDIYKEYHELSDRYNQYNNVINIYYLNNVLKDDEEIELNEKLRDLINYGIEMYDRTNGYINIALGNVIDVWKNYREIGKEIPTLNELMSAGSININDILLDDNIYRKTNSVKLDFGGISKGYATEIAGEYLETNGYTKYLINAGGNVKVGNKYKSSKYAIGLEEPFNTTNIYKSINIENNSIVTSGSYQRYYEKEGVIYSHIINPKTLFPENYTKSVTVITKDSKYADVLSTYLFLLPITDGLDLVNSLNDVEAIWYNDEIYYSDGFNIYE